MGPIQSNSKTRLVSVPYPAHIKGTGVLVDYEGHSCIVTGAHLLPSAVAASKALAYFVIPGIPRAIKIRLRPEAMFELLDKDKSIAITACFRPTAPSMVIPPAVPAPTEYAQTVRRFLFLGRLPSPISGALTGTGEVPDYSCSRCSTEPIQISKGRGRIRHADAEQDPTRKSGEISGMRFRRPAIIPGTRAHRRTCDPDPVEPFSITMDESGVIILEMVAHVHGGAKRVCHAAVLRSGWGGATKSAGEGGRGDRLAADDVIETKAEMPTMCSRGAYIAVVVAEQEHLDGVHGAPVFLGGQLFGFAIQERVGERVTEVALASALGLLPSSDIQEPVAGGAIGTALNPHGASFISTTGSSQCCEEERPGLYRGEKNLEGNGRGSEGSPTATTPLLEKIVHLFRHGTPLSLELELERVGEEALKTLLTPDGRSLAHLAAMSETLIPLEFVHRRLLMDIVFAEVSATGNTCVHLAAYCGRVNCLGYIASHGGDLLKKNRVGQTPAMLAVLTGRTGVLEWLLENTKNLEGAPDSVFPEELMHLVQDIDEAAVYGSPMYRFLLDALENNQSDEENEVPEVAGEKALSTDDKPETASQRSNPKTSADETAGVQPQQMKTLESKKLGGGRISPKTCSTEEVRRGKANATCAVSDMNGEHKAFRLLERGNERASLGWATKKYLRDSINAEQFYEEMVGMNETDRVEEAFIAKVIRGMPEDYAWALMEAHRKWRLEERASKKDFRKRRRNGGGSRRKAKLKDAQVRTGGVDDSSCATIFSLGAFTDASSLASYGNNGLDLEQLVARYKENKASAAELVALLVEVFGSQIQSILPAVLGTLPRRKCRELAKLVRTDMVPKAPRSRAPGRSREAPEILSNALGKNPIRATSRAAPATATKTIEVEKPTPGWGASNDRGFARPKRADLVRDTPQQNQQAALEGATLSGEITPKDQELRASDLNLSSGDEDDEMEFSLSKANSPFTTRNESRDEDDDDLRIQTFKKSSQNLRSNFFRRGLGRASSWAGSEEDRPPQKSTEETGPVAGKTKNSRCASSDRMMGERSRDQSDAAGDPIFSRGCGSKHGSGADGGDDDGHDDIDSGDSVNDENAQAGAAKKKKLASDGQRLTSAFASGRLTAPHFFGAMMECFGEERLLTALPDILKILPKDRAAELEAFTSEAKDKAGKASKARRKQKDIAETHWQESESRDTDISGKGQEQVKDISKAASAAEGTIKDVSESKTTTAAASPADRHETSRGVKAALQVKKRVKHTSSAAGHGDGCTINVIGKGKEKNMKGMTPVPLAPAPEPPAAPKPMGRPPDQAKRSKKDKKKGKNKNTVVVQDGCVTPEEEDGDVEGGELFEMSSTERKRYEQALSKLCPDGGAISPAKAASSLAKSGLPRDILRRIWEMADIERGEKLNEDEWVVAMHLVVCLTTRKLPLPARLPNCLRSSPFDHPPYKKDPQGNLRQQEGGPTSGKIKKKRPEIQGQNEGHANAVQRRMSFPAGLERDTEKFKNGNIEAEEFLSLLQETFGKHELATMWPKILRTLPAEKAQELVKTAGVDFFPDMGNSTKNSFPQQAGLKEATASFKKGEMPATEFYESVLKQAFGDKLNGMLPKIVKALPPDRAAALADVIQEEEDEDRRLAEEAQRKWAMALEDRHIYDKAFVKLDKDRDGFLSSTEAMPLLKKSVGDRLTESQMRNVWRMADLDGDGRLTREEWAIAYHIVRCVVKRQMELPPSLPEVLVATAEGRLPSL